MSTGTLATVGLVTCLNKPTSFCGIREICVQKEICEICEICVTIPMKTVKAVAPYIHSEHLNFKTAPYEAWVKLGGKTAKANYPPRLFHKLTFEHELPTLWKNNSETLTCPLSR